MPRTARSWPTMRLATLSLKSWPSSLRERSVVVCALFKMFCGNQSRLIGSGPLKATTPSTLYARNEPLFKLMPGEERAFASRPSALLAPLIDQTLYIRHYDDCHHKIFWEGAGRDNLCFLEALF